MQQGAITQLHPPWHWRESRCGSRVRVGQLLSGQPTNEHIVVDGTSTLCPSLSPVFIINPSPPPPLRLVPLICDTHQQPNRPQVPCSVVGRSPRAQQAAQGSAWQWWVSVSE